ncbi:MAG: alpha/beta hydrolase [Gammaproteobacteria bacterium]|nr:alpha/beta hydrolase [Gammaproteobacteria bacterium]MDH5653375.1 alpha/beta hydrolase [Gammaproteobacteria bacterium]
MKRAVTFFSEGAAIAADLYLPDDYAEGSKLPVIILCHGFAGIKELLLPAYAEAFAAAGYAALLFDYRGFGASEGERGRLIPREQVVDIRNAITYAETLPEVDADRIGLWGSSFGGANAVMTSAVDKRVKCLVVQLTFGNGERVITGSQNEADKAKLHAMLQKAWQRAVTKNKPMLLAVNQVLTDQQSQDFFTDAVEKFPELKVKIPITTLQHTIECIPEAVIPSVNIPVLIVAAEKDDVNPLSESESLFANANEPKSFFCVPGATHYEVYSGEKFKLVAEKQLAWFNQYL